MWKQHFEDDNIIFEIKNDAIQNEVLLKFLDQTKSYRIQTFPHMLKQLFLVSPGAVRDTNLYFPSFFLADILVK